MLVDAAAVVIQALDDHIESAVHTGESYLHGSPYISESFSSVRGHRAGRPIANQSTLVAVVFPRATTTVIPVGVTLV